VFYLYTCRHRYFNLETGCQSTNGQNEVCVVEATPYSSCKVPRFQMQICIPQELTKVGMQPRPSCKDCGQSEGKIVAMVHVLAN